MSFFSWLRSSTWNSVPRNRAQHRPATASFRPRLEGLEDRWVPAQVSLTVSSLADAGAGTLRAAILSADAGRHSDKFTIGFGVTGTIDLQSPLPDLNNSITIQGPGASSLKVERAAGYSFSSAIVTVDSGQSASLSGLTIANGDDGGIANYGTLSVSNSALSGNSAVAGGAIINFGTATVSGSALTGNTASGVGGAIFNQSFATLTVSACTVSGNSAAFGGAIFANDSGAVTFSHSTLAGNSAAFGGAIYNQFATLTVSGCTLTGNSATRDPGSHLFGIGGAIVNVSFPGFSGTLMVRDSLFSGNSAELGGAIYNGASGTLNVRGSTFSGNTASDSGGALYNTDGTATLQECTLSGNAAGTAGGGIFNGAFGALTVKDSTVTGNFAPSGADLFTLSAVALDDSTVGVAGP